MREAELSLAGQVIDSLVGEWHPEDFANDYRREVRAMLDAKLAGESIARPAPVTETPIVDLMEALRRSVAEVQERKGEAAPKQPSRKPKAVAAGSDGRARRGPSRKNS